MDEPKSHAAEMAKNRQRYKGPGESQDGYFNHEDGSQIDMSLAAPGVYRTKDSDGIGSGLGAVPHYAASNPP
jgi:hypothetical protein